MTLDKLQDKVTDLYLSTNRYDADVIQVIVELPSGERLSIDKLFYDPRIGKIVIEVEK